MAVVASLMLQNLGLSDLRIHDDRAFRAIPQYKRLKSLLVQDNYRFRVPEPGSPNARWAPVLFLNLSFWNAAESSDVLEEAAIHADVICHAAWHFAARKALQSGCAEALFLGEAIASAFDLYLVGVLLSAAPRCRFLSTQVPAMAEVAANAGLEDEQFSGLLAAVAENPEAAFEDLRALLFQVTLELYGCNGVEEGAAVLERHAGHRFAPLLHHYELSTWILYARAYGKGEDDGTVRAVDAALRTAAGSLRWLEENWL